jgi:hypothetical protein
VLIISIGLRSYLSTLSESVIKAIAILPWINIS